MGKMFSKNQFINSPAGLNIRKLNSTYIEAFSYPVYRLERDSGGRLLLQGLQA